MREGGRKGGREGGREGGGVKSESQHKLTLCTSLWDFEQINQLGDVFCQFLLGKQSHMIVT